MSPDFYRLLVEDRFLRSRYRRADRRSGVDYTCGSAILMFHHIAPQKPEGVRDSCFSTIDNFNSLLEILMKDKMIVSLEHLIEELRSGTVPHNKIVLTFDDVPDDFYTNAAPILHGLQTPYTLYIATSLLDTPGFLSTEQLKSIAANPLCTVGSHTVSHVKVREKGVDFIKELRESKKVLSGLLGREVNHFAFPYGTPFAVSPRQVRQIQQSGLYQSGVSTIPGFLNKTSIKNRFFLPRIHSGLFTQEYIKQ